MQKFHNSLTDASKETDQSEGKTIIPIEEASTSLCVRDQAPGALPFTASKPREIYNFPVQTNTQKSGSPYPSSAPIAIKTPSKNGSACGSILEFAPISVNFATSSSPVHAQPSDISNLLDLSPRDSQLPEADGNDPLIVSFGDESNEEEDTTGYVDSDEFHTIFHIGDCELLPSDSSAHQSPDDRGVLQHEIGIIRIPEPSDLTSSEGALPNTPPNSLKNEVQRFRNDCLVMGDLLSHSYFKNNSQAASPSMSPAQSPSSQVEQTTKSPRFGSGSSQDS